MMESLTIRVSRSTHGRLRELADQTGETMADIVDRAVHNYQKELFWAEYHAAYAAIKADPAAWADLQSEVESWDSTLADGLEDSSNERPKERDSVSG
jgi:predicted transcriptional regulator